MSAARPVSNVARSRQLNTSLRRTDGNREQCQRHARDLRILSNSSPRVDLRVHRAHAGSVRAWVDCPRASRVGGKCLVVSVPLCGRRHRDVSQTFARSAPLGRERREELRSTSLSPRSHEARGADLRNDLPSSSGHDDRRHLVDAQNRKSGLLVSKCAIGHTSEDWQASLTTVRHPPIARVRAMRSTECRRMLFKCSIALYMTAQLERAQRHLPKEETA